MPPTGVDFLEENVKVLIYWKTTQNILIKKRIKPTHKKYSKHSWGRE